MNNKNWENLKQNYYEKIFPNLTENDDYRLKELKKIFDTIDHNTYTIFVPELEKSLLFQCFSGKVDDDTFYGKHNNTIYKMIETKLTTKRGYNNQYGNVLFRGIVITFSLNKSFKGKTVILPKGVLSEIWNFQRLFCLLLFFTGWFSFCFLTKTIFMTIFGIISVAIVIFSIKDQKMQKILLEDSIIKSICDVYSTDQIEGRYLLTPAFIERFKNLQTIYGSKEIRCSFYDGKIMFAIPTNGNYFEIDDASLNNKKIYIKFYEEINAIFEMIDYFKFNEKTKL